MHRRYLLPNFLLVGWHSLHDADAVVHLFLESEITVELSLLVLRGRCRNPINHGVAIHDVYGMLKTYSDAWTSSRFISLC